MSPSWHNRLFVAISPDHISMIKLGRGLRPILLGKHDEAIAPVGKPDSWQAAVDRFARLLSQPEWQKAAVSVVLSSRLTRFASIAFSAQLNSYSAQEAFARHALTQTYGTVVDQWALRIQLGKAGWPSLVSAVDQALLDGLRQACAAQQLKLNLVTPYLTPVFNRFRTILKNDPAWLVIYEPGYSLLVLVARGEIIAINGVCHHSLDELPVLLDRENLVRSFNESCKSVYVYTPFSKDSLTADKRGYEFSNLDFAVPKEFPSTSDGLHAMTMTEFL